MRVFYSVIILWMIAIPSFTQTVWTGAVDSDYFNTANWSAGVPAPGNDGEIGATPINPVIGTATTIEYTLELFAPLTLDADVVNGGNIVISTTGELINNAELTNQANKVINSAGKITNNGTIENFGTVQSSGDGILDNNVDAFFSNAPGGLLKNFAVINNAGTVANGGVIDNCNVFNNLPGGTFVNGNLFSQGVDGTFNNQEGATFVNNLTINLSGVFINAVNTTVNNNGEINLNSNGFFTNNGLLINGDVFNNAGELINNGDISNLKTFTNNFGATLENAKAITNAPCATFRQFSSNDVACSSGCEFINNGIVYIISGAGALDISAGTGIVFNDINELPQPDAQCKEAMVVLNEDGEGNITLEDIDDGSSAGYCTIAMRELSKESFNCTNAGENVVTLTITDDLGFSDFCTAVVTVVDEGAPTFTFCPTDIEVDLASGECEGIAAWISPEAEDNCSFLLTQTDVSGFNSGDAFPIGITTIEYTANDGTNTAICTFDVIVNEFVPPTMTMACLGGIVNATVSENCEYNVLPNDVLVGFNYHCFDDYSVTLFYDEEMTEPVPTSPVLTSQEIGQVITVMVKDTEADISCWSKIRAEDKTDPEITCEDKAITCFDDNSPAVLGVPASWDNCDSGLTPTFEDLVTDLGCNASQENITKLITRIWTVTDFSGNSNSCVQTITVERPDFSTLEFPAHLDGIENDALSCAADPSTDPSSTGYPTILGMIIDNDECHFSSVFEDTTIPICDGTYKIIRNWTVYDWCTNASETGVQHIKIVDDEGPMLTCPGDKTISTTLNSCTGSIILPSVGIYDECSADFTTTIATTAGTLAGSALVDLPIGVTTVTYMVKDACNNPSSCSFDIEVGDEVPPIANCETSHTVGLTIEEPSLVNAIVFDDGSTDNCSDLTFDVRRMDNAACAGNDATPFNDKVPFYCCDVNGMVMVELRIKDESGNANSCMIEVIVQDKLDPIITCPSSAILDCYQDVNDLNLTNGEATAYDNCDVSVDFSDDGGLDNCGSGTIVRTWTATDPGGRTAVCYQYIIVENSTPFYISDTDCYNSNPNDGVIWPCDFDDDACATLTDPSTTGEPIIFEDACDLVSVTYEDTELPIIDNACVKIIRTWKVVDICQHDYNTGEGEWTYNQLIKILNTQAPEFTSDCNDQSFCSYDANCWEGFAELTASANDDCTPETDLRFSYEIDLNKNGVIDYNGSSANASNHYPIGHHLITWYVEDGCGNINQCEYDFVISDCKKPTVYCKSGLIIELMPHNSQIDIWANDFNQGSYDNCGIDEFRLAAPSSGPGQTVPPTSDYVVFDCDDVGTQTIDMWVKDINGNWDYCSTYVVVQDNNVSCGEQQNEYAMIAGDIQSEAGEMVESVTIEIEGNAPDIPTPNLTDADGTYSFPGLPMGFDYQIAPAKYDNPLNGVSTFDLVLIKRHILQIENLDSPYKMIAADINDNGSISTFDLVQLRRLILQMDEEFANNSSWRFVDADFIFPNASNPWETPFPEVYNITNLNDNSLGDFIAVKIGDINGNAATSGFSGSGDDRNMEAPLLFTAKDEILNPGRRYQIDFRSADINEIFGYQFTINFAKDRLKFVNIIPGALTGLELGNFGLSKLIEGSITTSWDRDFEMATLASDAILFSLIFEAQEQTTWSEALAFASKYTRAEAYHFNQDLLNVELHFQQTASIKQQFELYPNQPNPFIKESLISFTLPESTPLSFTIQNVSGQIVHSLNFEASAGYNEILIDRNMLEGPGVYFYTVKTKTHRVSQRMVLIRE